MPTEEKDKELTRGDKDSGDAGGTTDPLGERSFNQNRFVPLRANPENIAGDTAAKDENYGQNALSPDEYSEPNELPEETENRDTGRENPNEEGKNPLAESYENAPEDSGAERNTDAAKDTLKAPEEGGKNPIFKILTISSGITWFIIFFIVVVLILSVFAPSAPASENENNQVASGLCVPLKATDPTSATATNITNYSNNPTSIMHPGAFLDMKTLPDSESYLKVSNSMWGQPELVSLLEGVAAEWNRRHADVKIKYNDLSSKSGGPLSGHASHQVGVDVDVNNNSSPSFLMSNSGYDPNLAIELAKLFLDTKAIIFIFYNDSNIYNTVNSYASSNQLPGDIRFATGHENHFHVRIDKAKYKEACGY